MAEVLAEAILPIPGTNQNQGSALFERTYPSYMYIANGSQTGLDPTGEWSVIASVRLASELGTGEKYPIISKWGSLDDDKHYSVYLVESSGSVYLKAEWQDSDLRSATSPAAVDPSVGDWHRYGVLFEDPGSGGTWNVYFYDGTTLVGASAVAAGDRTTPLVQGDASVRIGGIEGEPTEGMDGYIDDVQFWSTCLSAASVAAWQSKMASGWETNLEGYWAIESGALGQDETQNDNDMTLSNVSSSGLYSFEDVKITDTDWSDYGCPSAFGAYKAVLGDVVLFSSGGGSLPNFLLWVKPMKNQFIASEDLEIVLPPFFDTASGAYVTSSDVCTLVVKKPGGSLLSPAPTASRDANTNHWVASVAASDYEKGQWLIKATSDAADTLPQYLVLTWGDYVDEIRQATCGRWRIVSNQLILYKDDGTTALLTFDLKDSDGNPTMTRIFERDPV